MDRAGNGETAEIGCNWTGLAADSTGLAADSTVT
jgi:hypothetical protein